MCPFFRVKNVALTCPTCVWSRWHVIHPVVHVTVVWITETLKDLACTLLTEGQMYLYTVNLNSRVVSCDLPIGSRRQRLLNYRGHRACYNSMEWLHYASVHQHHHHHQLKRLIGWLTFVDFFKYLYIYRSTNIATLWPIMAPVPWLGLWEFSISTKLTNVMSWLFFKGNKQHLQQFFLKTSRLTATTKIAIEYYWKESRSRPPIIWTLVRSSARVSSLYWQG